MGYVGPPFSGEFFIMASFSKSRLRLSEDCVGFCLQSILGGNPSSFAVSRLDDQVSRFVVSCKDVGLAVLRLGMFASLIFKVAFFLCNDHGFSEVYPILRVILAPCLTGWRFVLRRRLPRRLPSPTRWLVC